jgi:hypothetical protein
MTTPQLKQMHFEQVTTTILDYLPKHPTFMYGDQLWTSYVLTNNFICIWYCDYDRRLDRVHGGRYYIDNDNLHDEPRRTIVTCVKSWFTTGGAGLELHEYLNAMLGDL